MANQPMSKKAAAPKNRKQSVKKVRSESEKRVAVLINRLTKKDITVTELRNQDKKLFETLLGGFNSIRKAFPKLSYTEVVMLEMALLESYIKDGRIDFTFPEGKKYEKLKNKHETFVSGQKRPDIARRSLIFGHIVETISHIRKLNQEKYKDEPLRHNMILEAESFLKKYSNDTLVKEYFERKRNSVKKADRMIKVDLSKPLKTKKSTKTVKKAVKKIVRMKSNAEKRVELKTELLTILKSLEKVKSPERYKKIIEEYESGLEIYKALGTFTKRDKMYFDSMFLKSEMVLAKNMMFLYRAKKDKKNLVEIEEFLSDLQSYFETQYRNPGIQKDLKNLYLKEYISKLTDFNKFIKRRRSKRELDKKLASIYSEVDKHLDRIFEIENSNDYSQVMEKYEKALEVYKRSKRLTKEENEKLLNKLVVAECSMSINVISKYLETNRREQLEFINDLKLYFESQLTNPAINKSSRRIIKDQLLDIKNVLEAPSSAESQPRRAPEPSDSSSVLRPRRRVGPEPAPEVTPEPQPEPTPESQPEPQPQPQPQPESQPRPQPEPQPQSRRRVTPEPEPTPEPQPQSRRRVTPEPEPTPQPQPRRQRPQQPRPQPRRTRRRREPSAFMSFINRFFGRRRTSARLRVEDVQRMGEAEVTQSLKILGKKFKERKISIEELKIFLALYERREVLTGKSYKTSKEKILSIINKDQTLVRIADLISQGKKKKALRELKFLREFYKKDPDIQRRIADLQLDMNRQKKQEPKKKTLREALIATGREIFKLTAKLAPTAIFLAAILMLYTFTTNTARKVVIATPDPVSIVTTVPSAITQTALDVPSTLFSSPILIVVVIGVISYFVLTNKA